MLPLETTKKAVFRGLGLDSTEVLGIFSLKPATHGLQTPKPIMMCLVFYTEIGQRGCACYLKFIWACCTAKLQTALPRVKMIRTPPRYPGEQCIFVLYTA